MPCHDQVQVHPTSSSGRLLSLQSLLASGTATPPMLSPKEVSSCPAPLCPLSLYNAATSPTASMPSLYNVDCDIDEREIWRAWCPTWHRRERLGCVLLPESSVRMRRPRIVLLIESYVNAAAGQVRARRRKHSRRDGNARRHYNLDGLMGI